MKRTNIATGSRWEPLIGYSRVVRVEAQVFVTGTTATLPDGAHTEGGAYEQTKQAIANIAAALARAGATLEDVVRTRMYCTDIRRDWQEIGRAHGEAFGEILPATTMVEVTRLIDDWMLVEVEADAIIGARTSTPGV